MNIYAQRIVFDLLICPNASFSICSFPQSVVFDLLFDQSVEFDLPFLP